MAILELLREKNNLIELVMAKVAAPKVEQAIFIGCEIVDYPSKNLQVMVETPVEETISVYIIS